MERFGAGLLAHLFLFFWLCSLPLTAVLALPADSPRISDAVGVVDCSTDRAKALEPFVRPQETVPPAGARVYNLTGWGGRLGNNFVQIRHALRYAVCCRAVLVIAEHADLPRLRRHLDFTAYTGNFTDPTSCPDSFSAAGEFFFAFPGGKGNLNLPTCEISADFEFTAFQLILFGNRRGYGCDFPEFGCASGLENALVVHIRSGDIFGVRTNACTENLCRC